MAKPPSPLVGFNNNVRHQGRIFHVQTEDSGVTRPHIITHLFADGGRVIRSTRTDYSEHLGRTDMQDVVRRLMKEQHKAMFIALRDGQLDAAIERMCGADVPPQSLARPPEEPAQAPRGPAASIPESTVAEVAAAVAPAAEPPGSLGPVPRPPAPTLTDLVLHDLENARTRGPVPVEASRPDPKGGTPVLGTPAARPQPSGRYAMSRPSAIFSAAPDQASLFGGASISEQSLDEVILSYLAEDLEDEPHRG